jgi:hypothetical protein
MGPFTPLFHLIDGFLIAPYRWPENPAVGWWVGTFALAVWATLLGEATLALAHRVNRFRIKQVEEEMLKRHRQSIDALKAGDRTAYKSINKLANEAFGQTFFLRLAMACAALWPVACALGWLQMRFSGVRFKLPFALPLSGDSVSYPFVFIPLYVLVRILFGKIKARISRAREHDPPLSGPKDP